MMVIHWLMANVRTVLLIVAPVRRDPLQLVNNVLYFSTGLFLKIMGNVWSVLHSALFVIRPILPSAHSAHLSIMWTNIKVRVTPARRIA